MWAAKWIELLREAGFRFAKLENPTAGSTAPTDILPLEAYQTLFHTADRLAKVAGRVQPVQFVSILGDNARMPPLGQTCFAGDLSLSAGRFNPTMGLWCSGWLDNAKDIASVDLIRQIGKLDAVVLEILCGYTTISVGGAAGWLLQLYVPTNPKTPSLDDLSVAVLLVARSPADYVEGIDLWCKHFPPTIGDVGKPEGQVYLLGAYSSGALRLIKADLAESKRLPYGLVYGEKFPAVHQRVVEAASAQKAGLVLLHGPPGTGKTTYLRQLAKEVESTRRVVFVPPGMVASLSDPGFVSFLNREQNLRFDDDSDEVVPFRRQREARPPLLLIKEYNVMLAIDDDPVVCDMYRANGVLTLQVPRP